MLSPCGPPPPSEGMLREVQPGWKQTNIAWSHGRVDRRDLVGVSLFYGLWQLHPFKKEKHNGMGFGKQLGLELNMLCTTLTWHT